MDTEALRAAFAPQGVLRIAINLGNPILAGRDAGSGALVGVSVDIAGELARTLGVAVSLIPFETAGQSVAAVRAGNADAGFFAVDPARSEGIAFTAPYVLIEGAYLVRNDSALSDNAQVDAAGTTVVVGKGSAYDLFLTRTLTRAKLVRAESSQAVVDTFVAQSLDVAAGVRQQLEADCARHAGLRLLPGRFMVIQQAMGLPADRGAAAHAFLTRFIEEKKAQGFIAGALSRHGISGARVAPAAV